jgi:hypothetical protein
VGVGGHQQREQEPIALPRRPLPNPP